MMLSRSMELQPLDFSSQATTHIRTHQCLQQLIQHSGTILTEMNMARNMRCSLNKVHKRMQLKALLSLSKLLAKSNKIFINAKLDAHVNGLTMM